MLSLMSTGRLPSECSFFLFKGVPFDAFLLCKYQLRSLCCRAEEAEAEADSGAAAEPEKAEAPEKEAAPADNASA